MGLLGSVGILIYRTALPLTWLPLCLNPALSKATEIQPQAYLINPLRTKTHLRQAKEYSARQCSPGAKHNTFYLKNIFIKHLLGGMKRHLRHLLDIKTVVMGGDGH